jgi:hypothetical protein
VIDVALTAWMLMRDHSMPLRDLNGLCALLETAQDSPLNLCKRVIKARAGSALYV